MLCNQCNKNEATVFFKAVINNKVVQLNLCEKCAKEKGVEISFGKPSFSITDLLSGLSALSGQGTPPKTVLKCPACGLHYSSFKETGLLGCPQCYQSFSSVLEDLIKRLHGSTQHKGRSYTASSGTSNSKVKTVELDRLKKELSTAISKEDFEKATELRDQIRQIENK